eukprot:SAG22_NODE_1772_length_3611_cov_11.428815_3_plen_70_part_00
MYPPGFLNESKMSPIYLPLSIGLFNLSFKGPGLSTKRFTDLRLSSINRLEASLLNLLKSCKSSRSGILP